MDDTLGTLIERERERLRKERESIIEQQRELEAKLDAIRREMSAIDAYEAAKSGKQVAGASAGGRRGGGRGRRGSKREALMQVIRQAGNGLSRREILERMGLKGDKSGEMSVSNALTALTKSSQISRNGGKYFPGA
jgi:hypothetical protein